MNRKQVFILILVNYLIIYKIFSIFVNMEKKCNKCHQPKELLEFNKKSKSKDGYRYDCRVCQNKINKNHYKLNKKEIAIKRKITRKINKLEKNKKRREYYENNRENELKRCKEYYSNNKAKATLVRKKYVINNRDKINSLAETYRKRNPHIVAWRAVLRNTLKRFDKPKEGHTIELLGYSAIDLKNHIQSLFTEGMTWDNYGEWHIDHIKEVRYFSKVTPMNIVNELSNLRPLWSTTREINGIIYEGNLNRPKTVIF